MSEAVRITVMAFGVELDLVVECDVEPAEAPTRDCPGCAGGTYITAVYRADDKERENLLPEIDDEEIERLTELVNEALHDQAEAETVDYELDMAEHRAEARAEREMARWP